ncbi:serine hydrolase [Paenibacillus sp. FSL M7-1046]|uniref:serine hydrolase n=1 Tax=Paenibacillus sp. FSL M7-1046 TaxID=2975315 RepID=UPI0030F5B723
MKNKLQRLLAVPLVFLGMNVFMGHEAEAAATPAVPAALSASQLEQSIDPIMQEELEKRHIPGSAVVVTQGDRIIFSKGYGYADVEQSIPVDPAKTIMRLGSITKTVTAVSAMQLVEQGKLTLHDDLNTFLHAYQLPSFGKQPITLHHLLTHTAGLDESIYKIQAHSREKSLSAEQYLRQYFRQQPPVREPGQEYEYSNAGLGLVGNLIEQTAGTDLGAYMFQNVFTPLKMPSASLTVPESSPDMAKSYVYSNKKYTAVSSTYPHIPGAGALSVIPDEFAHFMIALLNQGVYQGTALLKPDSVEMMQQSQFAEHPKVDGVGYGLYRGHLADGSTVLTHTGEIEGFAAKMELIPSQKLGILIVSNGEEGGITYDKVTDAVAGLLTKKTEAVTPLPYSLEDLQQYERTYTFAKVPQHGWGKWLYFLGGRNYKVTAAEGELVVSGVFPDGSGETAEKSFVPIADGLFQEQESGMQLLIDKQHNWKMTIIQETTFSPEPGFWKRPSTLLIVYIVPGLLFLALLAVTLIRYVVRLFRKPRRTVSLHITAISLLMSVFLLLQLTYSNGAITFGYPVWYAWGVASLPLVAVLFALHLLWRNAGQSVKGKVVSLTRCFVAIACIGYTGFMYYWNMLSIHFS